MRRSGVDDILEKWLRGEDVSDEDVWEEWELEVLVDDDEEDDDGELG